MTYRDQLRAQADRAAGRMRALHRRYAAGDLDAAAFTALAVALLLRAQAAGVALADVTLAMHLSQKLRRAIPALGLTVTTTEVDATGKAVTTLLARLADAPDPEGRAARLASGRTTQTAGRAYDRAMRTRPEVAGYTRGLTAQPCRLCIALANGGQVFPADIPMSRHPSCTCVPIPVLTTKKGN